MCCFCQCLRTPFILSSPTAPTSLSLPPSTELFLLKQWIGEDVFRRIQFPFLTSLLWNYYCRLRFTYFHFSIHFFVVLLQCRSLLFLLKQWVCSPGNQFSNWTFYAILKVFGELVVEVDSPLLCFLVGIIDCWVSVIYSYCFLFIRFLSYDPYQSLSSLKRCSHSLCMQIPSSPIRHSLDPLKLGQESF